MPQPRENENRSDFISRCIPELMGEGKKQDQAIAQCHSIYQQSKKGKNEK